MKTIKDMTQDIASWDEVWAEAQAIVADQRRRGVHLKSHVAAAASWWQMVLLGRPVKTLMTR